MPKPYKQTEPDADPLHPHLTRGFLQYAQHRGFIVDLARKGHPKDKPKVERGVPYVRERFFKGGHFRDLADMSRAEGSWAAGVSKFSGLPAHVVHFSPAAYTGFTAGSNEVPSFA